MTVTKTIISDVIVPEVFNPYVIERTAELSAFYQSGIIARTLNWTDWQAPAANS
jgi:hypothetical protein